MSLLLSVAMETKFYHRPVLLEEVIKNLNPTKGKIILDATIGEGGHSEKILEKILPDGRLIGIDRDIEVLKFAKRRLERFKDNFTLVNGNFKELDEILKAQRIKKLDGILFDLGVSSFQLENPERGFSIKKNGPLDMRMDRSQRVSAFDIVNRLPERELAGIIRDLGEERFYRFIARRIVSERKSSPIETTARLVDIILKAVPSRRVHLRIHPATRTFLALRIKVNEELDALDKALDKAINFLGPFGRLCVVSFHSLEDRIVKRKFIHYSNLDIIRVMNKKPITPGPEEEFKNPRSRSAKLRTAEKLK